LIKGPSLGPGKVSFPACAVSLAASRPQPACLPLFQSIWTLAYPGLVDRQLLRLVPGSVHCLHVPRFATAQALADCGRQLCLARPLIRPAIPDSPKRTISQRLFLGFCEGASNSPHKTKSPILLLANVVHGGKKVDGRSCCCEGRRKAAGSRASQEEYCKSNQKCAASRAACPSVNLDLVSFERRWHIYSRSPRCDNTTHLCDKLYRKDYRRLDCIFESHKIHAASCSLTDAGHAT